MSSDRKVNVVINGDNVFEGELGTSGGKYSVQIKNRIKKEATSPLNPALDFKLLNWPKSP